MSTLRCSRAPEFTAGVCVVGLHQPASEEGHPGDRKGDQDQQSLTATLRTQVSVPKRQGKARIIVALYILSHIYFLTLHLLIINPCTTLLLSQYLIPFLLNQSGSLVYYYTLSTTGELHK